MRSTILVAILSGIPSAAGLAQPGLFDRDSDPVVLDGSMVGPLLGFPVDRIVGFRYQGAWQQIPVQIDERKFVDFGLVYNTTPSGSGTLAYADADTYTGADVDPAFDANDELVLMAKDAAGPAPAGAGLPAGVLPGTGLELEIVDPLDGGTAYVYLFRTDGSLLPGAGLDYVDYTFVLLAGPYIPNYSTLVGPNPESSVALTPFYRTHFTDRWIRPDLNVLAGTATGADILDRHKVMLFPGNCGRTEQTFSNGEGAFFANINGPVRGIRSYMGSNSGPATQRDHLFYERRQDIVSYLRVHGGITGPLDLYDYSPAATGMTYHNDLNPSGVTVNGAPDPVAPGLIAWEMVTGVQGSLIMSHTYETDIVPFSLTSYYSDNASPTVTQCTGDPFEYATSGPWVNQVMPNTDPHLGPHNFLTSSRTVYYGGPGQAVATAALRDAQARDPLTVTVSPYGAAPPGDCDGDGDVDLIDYGSFHNCLSGPGGGVGPGCDCFDLDSSGSVDLADFAGFTIGFTGG